MSDSLDHLTRVRQCGNKWSDYGS